LLCDNICAILKTDGILLYRKAYSDTVPYMELINIPENKNKLIGDLGIFEWALLYLETSNYTGKWS